MNVIKTLFEDVVVLEPKVWDDNRGYFFESYNEEKMIANGLNYKFVQDNEAKSTKGVLRGLHYQLPPYAQTKLVRVTEGEVLDVIVDLRKNSKTFGKVFSLLLSSTNFKQLLVPKGFAHGYIVLSETAVFAYKCDNFYHKDSERGVRFNDEDLNINWILSSAEFIVSDKDLILPSFKNHAPFE